ncbi:MAG: DUF3298 and DUF4163 domain-containing protein [Clostridiales bacterium]|nr:DUF3298 and DUF4163 domain-containing protein [Clostridiales bacterium]
MKMQCATALLLICVMLFAGCNISQPSPTQTGASPEPGKATFPPQDLTQPLIVRTNIYAFDNGYAIYPVIRGWNSISLINKKIQQVVTNYVNENSQYINDMDFDVMYNDKGIISIVLYAYGEDENITSYIPLNFDCTTGNQIFLNDLFPKNSDEWRQVLASNAQGLADKLALTLLSDIKPVDNDRQFYLTKNSLVLVYNLYEITTYAQGMPRFVITYHNLSGLIEQGSYIAKIVKE